MALPLGYPLRNLAHRRLRPGLTVAVIALVVIATTLFLGLVSSMRRTLATTGSPDNLSAKWWLPAKTSAFHSSFS